MKKTIEEIFDEMKRTFAERNKTYGDSYRITGHVFAAMFPNGLALNTPDQWNRFGAFYMIICKMVRYSETLTTGGHVDSAHDSAVYSAILEELTREYQASFAPIKRSKPLRRFVIFFKPGTDLEKKYAILKADTIGAATKRAFDLHDGKVQHIEDDVHVKVKDTLGLDCLYEEKEKQ